MKRKLLITLLSLVCVLSGAFGLTACGETDRPSGTHTHSYQWVDNGDGTHKQHCSVSGCDAPDANTESHVWSADNKCEKCNAVKTGDYTVVYDANGGRFEKEDIELDDVTLDDGTVISADGTKMTLTTKQKELMPPLKTPTRAQYAFTGWAKDKDGETLWNFDTDELSGNITLYAVWTVTFDYKLSDDKSYYIVRGIGGLAGDVEIPETHNGKPVTEIAASAFKNESKLTGIVIPNSVTVIGNAAFMRCNNLLSVSIGEGITELPEQLFDECDKLESVTLPKSAAVFCEQSFGSVDSLPALTEVHYGGTIDDWCTIEMESYIILNQGVNQPANPLSNGKAKLYIGGNAVSDITVNAKKINPNAFYQCGTINGVTIGNNVKEIGAKAFYINGNLTSLNFASGSTLTTIGESAFKNTRLLSLTLPASMETVQAEAFYDCRSLTSVHLGGTKYVYSDAFSLCDNLNTLDLGQAEELGSGAFSSCSLTSVTIPDTVWYMEGSFSLNSGLNSVTFASQSDWQVTEMGTTKTETGNNLTNPTQNAVKIKQNGTWIRIAGTLTYYQWTPDTYEVTGVENKNGRGILIIPATYNGKSVTSISRSAFYGCSGLTSVTIPDSVTDIRNNAFYGCSSIERINYTGDIASWCRISLYEYFPTSKVYIGYQKLTEMTDITIPNGVTSIGPYVFYGCSSLTSISIPNSVTYIGRNAFSGCSSLTSISIPNSVTSIGSSAFSGCSSLTSITIPNSVTNINGSAFSGCSSLTSISIPNGVTSIGQDAFRNCSGLTSITIPDSVTSIRSNAFYGCSHLTIYCEAAEKPSEWSSDWSYSSCPIIWDCKNNNKDKNGYAYAVIDGIRYSLIDGNATVISLPSSIVTVDIPATVTYKETEYSVTGIGINAFSGCSNLTSITIPNSVTSIGSSAFHGCSSLTSITIPDSVTYIGYQVFKDCSGLTIYCEALEKPSGWNSDWNYSSAYPAVWDCKNNDKDKNGYAYAVIDGIRYSLIDGNATVIEQVRTISGNIVLPITVTYNNISYSVTRIDEYAFANCSSLTSVTIGNGVTRIDEYAFANCSSLTSVTIGNGVTRIDEYAFANCSSLTRITIGNGVTRIGRNAFRDCSSLTRITIGNGVTRIDEYAFSGCRSIKSISIPNSVTYIGRNAFMDCSSLTSITIPNSVTSIGSSAFMDCSGLTSVTIPDSVTSIDGSAFSGCSSLKSISIPNSVTYIDRSSFHGCSNLTSITYNGTMAQWNAISKYSNWNSGTGDYTVHCTDGKLDKNGNEITE